MSEPPRSPSTGSEYARHVRDALAQAERFDRAQHPAPEGSGSWASPGLLTGLFLALMGVVGYNGVVLRRPPPPPSVEEVRQTQAVGALAATQAVEAFREEHGRLPRTLEEAGLPAGLLEYEVRGEDYVLSSPAREGAAAPAQDPLTSLRELGVDPERIRWDP